MGLPFTDMSEPTAETGSPDLTVGRTRLGLYLGVVLALVLVAVAAWFMLHPSPLPTSDRTLEVRTPVGAPVYVAVYSGSRTDRTIQLSSVHVNAPADSTAEVTARVCAGGSLSVTADPAGFCTRVLPAAGASLGPDDTLMLEISSDTAGTLVLDDLQVSYREGLQWGTQPVGPRVSVTFLSR
jgi:hypothetical protein